MGVAVSGLRVVHIAAGVTALLAFWIPLVVRKGNSLHRRAGWTYTIAMYVAAATAVALAPLRFMQWPRERSVFSLFLAHIGLLSFVAARYGTQVLTQKKRDQPLPLSIDLALPFALLATTIATAVYGWAMGFLLPLYFAPVGVLVAWPQIRTMLKAPVSRTWWLGEHITAMGAACIATVTAFAVNNAGRFFHSFTLPVVWLAPAILGVPLLARLKRSYLGPKPPPMEVRESTPSTA